MTEKHIITLNPEAVGAFAKHTGCGECPTSCQSACKTSCTVGNQVCLNNGEEKEGK
ncbi:MAG: six-cysteine ranthipeptide SCIFF [Firmicutes bacterium]|nr:six-cysteine ranthipeptide SCIFF [Bacillota bacterium]